MEDTWKEKAAEEILSRINREYDLYPTQSEVVAIIDQYCPLEDILRKYIDVVVNNEGVSFLYDNEWEPEEWTIIDQIAKSERK